MKKILFIVGPTAVGKSALAIQAAKLLNSEVISADSMQIYKYMDIGTAKVTESEMQGVKHHLINLVDPADSFSVAQYQANAVNCIENLFSKGKVPIVCGGTGLYIDSIIYPLNFSESAKNVTLRNELNEELQKFGAQYIHDKLALLDKTSAEKIHVNDTKRVIRALEINLDKGNNRTQGEKIQPKYDFLMLELNPENRDELYHRINCRVENMVEQGLVEEIDALLSRGVDFDCQSMQAIGYKEFRLFKNNEISFDELKNLIMKNTRNYAKRQLTWFRKYKDVKIFNAPCQRALDLIEYTFNNL